ncbi:MAG: hypothetical protein U9Q16_00515 [Patescibacteria group bacterium]|nr:hypothetical protein [Patescibacteria group bacterium]
MRLTQDKKLKPRRLSRKRICLSVFGISQFGEKIRKCLRVILGYIGLFFRRAVFVRLLVFILIVGWIFSGWPQIFNFPPKTQYIQAATLSTLRPIADGTIDSEVVHDAGTAAPFYSHIDDDPDSPNTSDWIASSLNEIAASAFFDVTNMPSDFDTMSTLEIKIDFEAIGFDDDTAVLYAQMYQSDESTTLSDEMQLATQATGSGLVTVSFTNVSAGSKTIWDGARIHFRWTYTKNKGPDNAQLKITATELNGTYVVSSGTLTVDIVDGAGSPVASPSMAMTAVTFSFDYQTASGTFGVSTEKIRVENTTANPQWSLTIAANGGSTAFWDSAGTDYDFNDPTANAGDGGDADGLGGQMTINASGGTLGGTCSATGITKGSSTSFSEGATDSITLLTAGATADTSCYWDFTGISVSQTVPAEQPAASDYSINMTLTVTAL